MDPPSWPPCATSPSAATAWPATTTSPAPAAAPPDTRIEPSHYAHNCRINYAETVVPLRPWLRLHATQPCFAPSQPTVRDLRTDPLPLGHRCSPGSTDSPADPHFRGVAPHVVPATHAPTGTPTGSARLIVMV